MKEEKLLKSGYRRYTQKDESVLLQKKFSDYIGIKYFVNCYMYVINNEKRFEFKVQITTEYGTINTCLFGTTLNIMEIERFMEDLWVHYGKNYYERFTNQDNSEINSHPSIKRNKIEARDDASLIQDVNRNDHEVKGK